MIDASIDPEFTAHSSGAASTTHCDTQGLYVNGIMKSAGWSNGSKFAKFCSKPILAENFGVKDHMNGFILSYCKRIPGNTVEF